MSAYVKCVDFLSRKNNLIAVTFWYIHPSVRSFSQWHSVHIWLWKGPFDWLSLILALKRTVIWFSSSNFWLWKEPFEQDVGIPFCPYGVEKPTCHRFDSCSTSLSAQPLLVIFVFSFAFSLRSPWKFACITIFRPKSTRFWKLCPQNYAEHTEIVFKFGILQKSKLYFLPLIY